MKSLLVSTLVCAAFGLATPAFAAHWFGDSFSAEAVKLAPAVVSERMLLGRYLAQEFDITGAFPHHTMPAAAALENCILQGVLWSSSLPVSVTVVFSILQRVPTP